MTSRDTWTDISFRRAGGEIVTTGISFSGKIVRMATRDNFEVWHVKPGMVWSGMGRPWRRTPSRLFLVEITGETAKIIEQCEPGVHWRTHRALYLAKLNSSSLK